MVRNPEERKKEWEQFKERKILPQEWKRNGMTRGNVTANKIRIIWLFLPLSRIPEPGKCEE